MTTEYLYSDKMYLTSEQRLNQPGVDDRVVFQVLVFVDHFIRTEQSQQINISKYYGIKLLSLLQQRSNLHDFYLK